MAVSPVASRAHMIEERCNSKRSPAAINPSASSEVGSGQQSSKQQVVISELGRHADQKGNDAAQSHDTALRGKRDSAVSAARDLTRAALPGVGVGVRVGHRGLQRVGRKLPDCVEHRVGGL